MSADRSVLMLLARIANDFQELQARLGLIAEPCAISDAILTPQQVAGRLRISEGQARRRMKRSMVAFYRGGRLFVRAADLGLLNGRV